MSCLGTLRTIHNLKFHGFAFPQGSTAVALNGRVMHKNICTVIPSDKAVAFRAVEPFYSAPRATLTFWSQLGGRITVRDACVHHARR